MSVVQRALKRSRALLTPSQQHSHPLLSVCSYAAFAQHHLPRTSPPVRRSLPPPCPSHPVRCLSTSRAEKSAAYQRRSYQDRVRVQVTGGVGGNGCSSFARTMKGIGAPNGGSGGPGGDVLIQCADDSSARGLSLSSYHIKAGNGGNGTSDSRTGRRGDDTILAVPAGTIVSRITHRDPTTLELHTQHLVDLHTAGQRIKVAAGGEGGYGNRALVTGYRTNNRFSSAGQVGDSNWLLLQLRTIADVGLVGMPNAGKSSLLAALTNAEPKIAAYPFTTLHPQVGVVNLPSPTATPDAAAPPTDSFTMADLPGLIEDAHLDVGLGHAFLQHLHRCSVLLYVLDCSPLPAAQSQRDPSTDFLALRRELRMYDERLCSKPWLVFANQMDRRPATARKQFNRLQQVVASELSLSHAQQAVEDVLVGGSCLKRQGLDELVQRVWQLKARQALEDERERVEMEERMRVQRQVEARAASVRQQESNERQRKYDGLMAKRRKGKRMTAIPNNDEQAV